MKMWQYMTLVVLGLTSVVAGVVIVVLALKGEDLQRELQVRQARLNSGVLGQQAQAVTSGILQDMANVASSNPKMRDLLSKHGYTVAPGAGQQNKTGQPPAGDRE